MAPACTPSKIITSNENTKCKQHTQMYHAALQRRSGCVQSSHKLLIVNRLKHSSEMQSKHPQHDKKSPSASLLARNQIFGSGCSTNARPHRLLRLLEHTEDTVKQTGTPQRRLDTLLLSTRHANTQLHFERQSATNCSLTISSHSLCTNNHPS